MSIGFQEIILIVVVVVLLFGARRIPELARALGRASYEFKKAKNELKKETDALVEEPGENAAPAAKEEKSAGGEEQK